VTAGILHGHTGYHAIAAAANSVYGIPVQSDVLRRYVALMKTPAPTKVIGGFLKKMNANPALKKQYLSSAGSYDALAAIAVANGAIVTALDMQNYLTPWQIFVQMLRALLTAGTISPQQFTDHAGFAPDDGGISGMGLAADIALMEASVSAAGWATKLMPISNFSMPIGALVFPTSAIVIAGMEGQTFTSHDVGNMFAQSYSDAMATTADQLNSFHDDVSSIF
jgi:hypothetical protein